MQSTRTVRVLLALVVIGTFGYAAIHAAQTPDAVLVDGGRYYGPLVNGLLHGDGRIDWPSGSRYEGEFAQGRFSGRGRLRHARGDVYDGEFRNGAMSGKGRFETAAGDVYEGDFADDAFTGSGVFTSKDGRRHEGRFLKWRAQGPGRYVDPSGNVYEGTFSDGDLVGTAKVSGKGYAYEGDIKQWTFHGQGVLRMPNGDVYKGHFAYGQYDGTGTLTYATPQADGTKELHGTWRHGRPYNKAQEQQAKLDAEAALYTQRALLDRTLAALAPRDPHKINLYLLAVAGDGSQEVFRREVEFVQKYFDERFATRSRSVALVNSRNTVAMTPMATVTSIREALHAIAARMDRQHDILFLMLTSHGSAEHELVLNQNHFDLRGLEARELGRLLKESGIRWKVVLVSACYSGGFIDHVKDEQTLVITAARHDRRSFGCADQNDFTDFGRAFFKDALPTSGSFGEAFKKAAALVNEWEKKNNIESGQTEPHSLPQIVAPAAITTQLDRWWAQHAADRGAAVAVQPVR